MLPSLIVVIVVVARLIPTTMATKFFQPDTCHGGSRSADLIATKATSSKATTTTTKTTTRICWRVHTLQCWPTWPAFAHRNVSRCLKRSGMVVAKQTSSTQAVSLGSAPVAGRPLACSLRRLLQSNRWPTPRTSRREQLPLELDADSASGSASTSQNGATSVH